MFKKLGEGYKNHIERYSNIRRYAAVYSLAGGLAASVLLPLGDAHGANKSAIQGKPKTNEIAAVVGNGGNAPGSAILWRYDGKGGYVPIFKQDGLKGFPGVAIGDTDNDGKNEVVATSRGGSYIIRCKDGRFVSEKLDDYKNETRSVVIGDADNDGRNEVLIFEWGSTPANLHVYRRKDGKYEKEVLPGLVGLNMGGKIVDVDGDGRNEILSLAMAEGVAVTEYRNGKLQIDHVLTGKGNLRFLKIMSDGYAQVGYEGEILPLLDTIMNTDMDIGDITGDGSKCLLLSDFVGQAQVVKLAGKGYENLFLYELHDTSKLYKEGGPHKEYFRSCAIGDVDNDGDNEMVVGSKRLWVFDYDGETFKKMWESEKLEGEKTMMNVAGICIADSDNDGLNELLYDEPAGLSETLKRGDGFPVRMHRLVVLKNRSRGKMEFDRAWQSEPHPGYFRIAVGDIDGK